MAVNRPRLMVCATRDPALGAMPRQRPRRGATCDGAVLPSAQTPQQRAVRPRRSGPTRGRMVACAPPTPAQRRHRPASTGRRVGCTLCIRVRGTRHNRSTSRRTAYASDALLRSMGASRLPPPEHTDPSETRGPPALLRVTSRSRPPTMTKERRSHNFARRPRRGARRARSASHTCADVNAVLVLSPVPHGTVRLVPLAQPGPVRSGPPRVLLLAHRGSGPCGEWQVRFLSSGIAASTFTWNAGTCPLVARRARPQPEPRPTV